MEMLDLPQISREMNDVADADQAPVVVDRLQFLRWVTSLNRILDPAGSSPVDIPESPDGAS